MSEAVHVISLDDKYEQQAGRVYMTGIQALVRLPMDRIRLDRHAGQNVAGYISGYRGSPLGIYDQQAAIAKQHLDDHNVLFRAAVNEELAATAIWGTQKVGLAGRGSDYDGVLGIWYGKAPGVDRSCDAFRHANHAGTARHGGVLAVAGDDPLAKSSTIVGQSEPAFMDVEMPVFTPSNIQDVLDYGLHAFALSRYASVWTGMIALADMMDASGMVNVDPARLNFRLPDPIFDPRAMGEMNRVMALAGRLDHETTLRELRLPAAREYIRVNELNHLAFGAQKPRIGLVAAGKAYRDLLQAFQLLGLSEARLADAGIGVFKVAVAWPLEPVGLKTFAAGLDQLMVVEHKRPILEPQIKEQAYIWEASERPPIWGKVTPDGAPFLPMVKEVSSFELVPALLEFLPDEVIGEEQQALADRLAEQAEWASDNASDATRIPYFCSGCPHSSSTVVPDGSRVQAGIGCHSMTEATGRITDSLTMMGGEGMHWVGQYPFDKDNHVFANLGDGTYFHSGILAIRQAIAAKAPMTYKILYNDAVAMTGGQPVDGQLTVPQMTHQLKAEGVQKIIIVSEKPESYGSDVGLAVGVDVRHRDLLVETEEELSVFENVSVLIYDQTCAAEKRRRRKRGTYEIPGHRYFINDRICEGCGDCSVQSNCLSIEPLETSFGTKRAINQSSCNMDFTCVKGFCPSFVKVEGAVLRKADSLALDPDDLIKDLEEPAFVPLNGTYNILVGGIGGMGVTTIAAVLAMAAHIDGLNASTVDMTGIAQKGGPVTSHLRLAPEDQDIEGPRIPVASADLALAGDLLVASNQENLGLLHADRSRLIGNNEVAPTAEFVLHQRLSFDADVLQGLLGRSVAEGSFAPVAQIGEDLLGDAIYANMILVGMAWQQGLLPISASSIETAITLNKAAVANNIRAFAIGRLAVANPSKLETLLPAIEEEPERPEDDLDFYAEELALYQSRGYAKRYRKVIETLRAAEENATGSVGPISELATRNLYRLMSYKDEYEVSRLMLDDDFQKKLDVKFSNYEEIKLELAPPFLPGVDAKTGWPRKRSFGRWTWRLMGLMTRFKRLRGTPLDVFGYSAERKLERQWLKTYMADLKWITETLSPANAERMVPVAESPSDIRGFGPIKMEAMDAAFAKRKIALEAAKNPKGESLVRKAREQAELKG